MYLALVLALAVGSLEGMVVVDDQPLPGCTVTLTAPGSPRHTVVSDAYGVYAFHGVEPGEYTLDVTLEGLNPAQRQVRIVDGSNEQEPVALSLAVLVQPLIIHCGFAFDCNETPPQTIWDSPACADHHANRKLLDALANGDRSVLELLRRRYDEAFTYAEKHEIAAALLGRVPDDSLYWTELFAHATDAVRFAAEEPPTSDSYRVAVSAFFRIARDPRARPLLIEATQSPDESLAEFAQQKLGMQRETP